MGQKWNYEYAITTNLDLLSASSPIPKFEKETQTTDNYVSWLVSNHVLHIPEYSKQWEFGTWLESDEHWLPSLSIFNCKF